MLARRVIILLFAVTLPAHSAPSQTPPAATPPPGASPATTQPADPDHGRRPPEGLLSPISETGGLPAIYSKMYDLTAQEIKQRAVARGYAKQIRAIRHKHFGDIKVESIRQAGIELLHEFTDPAAFAPMIEELKREKDDVRLAMLDHFSQYGDEGQAALAYVAIYDDNAAIRNEALRRMVSPAPESVRYVLNGALRSDKDQVANAAASLAGALHVIESVPLLIFAQATATPNTGEGEGDLAWIAITTQRAFVAGLQPVVGDASGAFQPIMGVVADGVVMRVVDAVVISYRTVVHEVLVNMTTSDWGQPTDPMGYNIRAWWDWYNDKYVPYKRDQATEAAAAQDPPPTNAP